jgi:hypothetical protein
LDIKSAWETITENIRILDKESLGFIKLWRIKHSSTKYPQYLE